MMPIVKNTVLYSWNVLRKQILSVLMTKREERKEEKKNTNYIR